MLLMKLRSTFPFSAIEITKASSGDSVVEIFLSEVAISFLKISALSTKLPSLSNFSNAFRKCNVESSFNN